ncbi:MAG: Prolyl oligopeptidase family protein, partial [uncultured Rubrobacteraceae bacterium]
GPARSRPVRLVEVSHLLGPHSPGRRRPEGHGPRRRRRLLAGEPTRGGRAERDRPPLPRRQHQGRHPPSVQRPHPRPRVRRRRLRGPRRHGLFRQLRGPAALLRPPRGRTGAAHGGGSPPLRGHDGGRRQGPPHRRARGPHGGGRAGKRGGRHRPRGRRRDRARLRQRLLLLAPAEPGRTKAGLAHLEPPEHALGRHGALDGRVGRRRRAARGREAGGRPRRVSPPARVVPGRDAPPRLRPDRLVEPVPGGRGRGRAALPDGGRVRAAALGLRDVHLRLPLPDADSVRPDPARRLPPGHPGHRDRGARRGRDALLRRQLSPREWRLGRASLYSRLAHGLHLRRAPRHGDGRTGGAAPGGGPRDRRGLPLRPRDRRVPDGGRPDGPRLLLPAGEQGPRGPRGREAAAARAEPRGTYRHDPAQPGSGDTAQDQPRFRRARRQLRRLHGLRPRVPATARRDVGCCGRGRLRQRGQVPRGEGRGGRRAAPDRGRQRRRVHDAVRADVQGGVRGGRELLRRQRRGGPGRGDPQVRVEVPGPPDRALPRTRGPLPGTLPHPPYRRPLLPRRLLPGPRRRGGPAEPGRDDVRSLEGEGPPRRLRPVRGRAARLPPRGEHQAGSGRRALFLLPRLRFRPRRPRRARPHREPGRTGGM